MGATHVTVTIRNPAEPDRTWEGLFLVDTGATDSLVPRPHLESIGLEPKGQRSYEVSRRPVKSSWISQLGRSNSWESSSVERYYSAKRTPEPLLGVTALESVGIEVDPLNQRLKRLPAVRLKNIGSR